MAKAGDDGNLNGTRPISSTASLKDVVIEAFNYQHDRLGLARTIRMEAQSQSAVLPDCCQVSRKGRIPPFRRRFITQHEHVSGSRKIGEKGVNGFIYGEREPGLKDSLYLSFMLFDKEKVLPKNYPSFFN